MRTEDRDEFTDRREGRGRTHGNQDDRDPSYGRRESAGRQPARAGRGAPPAGVSSSGRSGTGRQDSGVRPPSTGRDADERRDQPPPRNHGRARQLGDARDARGYQADQGFDQGGARAYDDRRSGPAATGPQKRRRPDNGTQHRPGDAPAPTRSRRRSGDSSEWDSSEWEKLSDIDYWAELAAHKPLTTTPAQPGPQRPAGPRDGAGARPGHDPEPETLAARASVPGAVPRRDPVTGLPVRGPEPADIGLAPAAGSAGFVPAPVSVAGPQDGPRPPAAPNGDLGGSRRPPAGRDGDRPSRPRPPAASAGQPGQRVLDAPGRDPGRYLDVGPASLPMPAIRDIPPEAPAIPAAPAATVPPPTGRERTPVPLDDDPLTSPSFPKIPASDSRSYRNGRADTPPGGSRAPASYPAATPQLPGYGSAAAQYPTAQYATAQYPTMPYPDPQYPTAQYPTAQYPTAQYPTAQYPTAQYPTAQYPTTQPSAVPRSAPERPAAQHPATQPQYLGDEDRTDPNAYRADPLSSRGPYPARAGNGSAGPASIPPGRGPAPGNPYGSYVTPGSQQIAASGYNGYPATPGNGHGHPYPSAVTGDPGHSGNGYWQQPGPVSGSLPDLGGASYLQAPPQAGQPRHADAQEPGYRSGYGRYGQAEYPPNSSPAGPGDPAGYAPADPYGSDRYSGYPGYGAAGR